MLSAALYARVHFVLCKPHADISVEVGDVDACYTAAQQQGCSIVYPLTDQPWGVQRFFVRDPNGVIVYVVSHKA